MSLFGELATLGTRSWEEVLEPGERLGGPSGHGYSHWDVFKRCPYLFLRTRLQQWEPEEREPALEIGGLFHEAVARYYTAALALRQDDRRFTKADDQECVQAGLDLINKADGIVPETSGMARHLYRSRMAIHGPGTPLDDRREVQGIEVAVEVLSPFRYSTRLDRWRHDEVLNGPIVIELKSAGERSQKLLSSYRMDSQFLGQIYLWNRCMSRRHGKLKAYLVELCTKSAQSSVTYEPVPLVTDVLKDWALEMKHLARRLAICTSDNEWPRNRTYNCRWCRMFDHCASGGRTTVGWKVP